MKLTATDVCHALASDAHPDSGWVRWANTRKIYEPREAWLASHTIWVRANGRFASGWRGCEHVSGRFGPISAFRIRRAVKAWAARSSQAPPPLPCRPEGQHSAGGEG